MVWGTQIQNKVLSLGASGRPGGHSEDPRNIQRPNLEVLSPRKMDGYMSIQRKDAVPKEEEVASWKK